MVDTIYELKNRIVEKLDKDVRERGVERLDDAMVDMVKDLAEAEKACWEAAYYRAVTEAMEGKSGYMPENAGYNRSMGYRDSMGRYARRGYMGHSDALEGMRYAIEGASPEERERMKAEARQMLGL